MQADLLSYYNQELRFFREMASKFAAKYPAVASALQHPEKTSADPHVERLIEAFAFMSARIQKKIEDGFPEVTESFLDILYPHYLRPIPSMTIVQFELPRDQSNIANGQAIPKETQLRSKPINGTPIQFRTCYPVTLWPIEIASASVVQAASLGPGLSSIPNAFAAIRIELKTFGGAKLNEMELSTLRFYLNGEGESVYTLYELLFNNAFQAVVRDVGTIGEFRVLPPNFLRPVGYGEDEGLLPYDGRSFLGYRLLQEFFVFPKKFLFFEVHGLGGAARLSGERVELIILLNEFGRRQRLSELQRSVNADTFLLGCTPGVNLFQRLAEPIQVTQRKTEYRVVADRYHESTTEVYSIERVVASRANTPDAIEYRPFYSLRHGYESAQQPTTFWISRRRSPVDDNTVSDLYLSLVDLEFGPNAIPGDVLTVYLTCMNRNFQDAPFVGSDDGFDLEAALMVRVRCRHQPTGIIRPPLGGGLQWRLISHLALNGLSISGGSEALQEILKLYDFADDPVVRSQIAGISDVSSSPHIAHVTWNNGVILCLGTRVEIEFDEDQFVGTGVFLMASVLERFISLYSAVNSYSQLYTRSRQRKGYLKIWPPRMGEQIRH